jgi:hypothetical protein
MQRIQIAAVTVTVAAGLIGAVATPASAERPGNFGTCVKLGQVEPSAGEIGAANRQAQARTHGLGGNVFNVFPRSGEHSRFSSSTSCIIDDD